MLDSKKIEEETGGFAVSELPELHVSSDFDYGEDMYELFISSIFKMKFIVNFKKVEENDALISNTDILGH